MNNRIVVRNGKKRITTAQQAIHYCVMECPIRGALGCALDCELRKRFHIPPHGDKYHNTENYRRETE